VSLRLAELLVGLAGVTDPGMGQPIGEAARTCLVATRLAQRAADDDASVATVYYTGLLMHAGCTAYSFELSRLMADEQSVKRTALYTNFADPRDVAVGFLATITRQAPAGRSSAL
jgi:hypothetical protein